MADDTTNQLKPYDFSIVVLGAMNPRLHHPIWYKQQRLIDDAELNQSLTKEMICLAEASQFTAAGMYISCNLDRWDIRTTDLALRPRILEIARTIFDTSLPETPSGLFAFNNDFHRMTELTDVKRILGELVAGGCFGLSPEVLSGAMFFTVAVPDGGEMRIRIDPSPQGPDFVSVKVNANHPVKVPPGRFNLGPLLDKFYESDYQMAARYAEDIVKSLNASRKGCL